MLDPGSNSIRAGFAGEDTPKSIVPSFYGQHQKSTENTSYLIGDNAVHRPLSNIDIKNPFDSEGIVEDWDAASKLFEYSFTSRLTGVSQTPASKNGLNDSDGDVAMEAVQEMEKPLAENPLLMTEPAWNPSKAREQSIQLALEDWGAPAFFLGKTGVLAA